MAMSDLAGGEILAGKYRVERVLGRGGMGMVVAATHLQLDKRVALKFVLPEMVHRADLVARFLREARAASRIQSEHVARVLDVGTLENGAPFIVMEYLDGQDLEQLVKQRGALPMPVAATYVLQACEALAEAHAGGIVHRDLKPANLFLTARADGSPSIKVLDFGISKVALSASEGGITQTAAMMGSPSYMAPEQIKSARSVDARADIWSLGIILHELLTGDVAFKADTLPELYVAILQEPPTPLRRLRADAHPAMEALILRCLEKDPARRFPNVAELGWGLANLAPPEARLSAERIARILGVPSPSAPTAVATPSLMRPSGHADPAFAPGPQADPRPAYAVPATNASPPPAARVPSYPAPRQASQPDRSYPPSPPSPNQVQGAYGPPAPGTFGHGAPAPGMVSRGPFVHDPAGYPQAPYPVPARTAPRPRPGPTPATIGLIVIVLAVVFVFGSCAMCVCVSAAADHQNHTKSLR